MEQDEISLDRNTLLRIKIEYQKNSTFVTFLDDRIVDEEQVRKVHEALKPVIEENGDKQLILNFARIKLINSVLLNLLVSVRKRVCELGGQIRLCNLNANLYRILEITQLADVFNIS
jgi:anti-anti-sigma factor